MTPVTVEMVLPAVLALLAWAVTLRRIVVEPRRTVHGLALVGCVFLTWVSAVVLVERLISDVDVARWMEFGPVVCGLLVSIGVGVFLVRNSATMIRREGRGLMALVPAAIGCLLLAGVAGSVVAVGGLGGEFALFVVLLALPLLSAILMIVVELIGFTLYTLIYGRLGRVESADVVVVLGAGLSGDEPTPLLAGRVDRGIELFEHSREQGLDPVLVMSGGKGADEVLAEAEAMARYAVRTGILSEDSVLCENRSTTTEENLRNTRELLADRGIGWDRLAVVTSNFHVLRTSTLTRRLGIPAAVVGAPTASYYLPAGFLREFVAVLARHRVSNIVAWLLLVLTTWAGCGFLYYLALYGGLG